MASICCALSSAIARCLYAYAMNFDDAASPAPNSQSNSAVRRQAISYCCGGLGPSITRELDAVLIGQVFGKLAELELGSLSHFNKKF
jgi:hypothetical protein